LEHFLQRAALELLIFQEIERRAKSDKVGRHLYGAITTGEFDREALLAELNAEKITSYRPAKESDEDLKQLRLEKLWESYRRIGSQRASISPRVKRDSRATVRCWDKLLPQLAIEEMKCLMREVWPLLPSQVEKLSERARQKWRDYFHSWSMQKRTGEEVSLNEADRILLSLERSSSRVWRQKGERLEENRGRDNISYLDIKRAFLQVKERHGEKGERFLKALPETGFNITKASKIAGISRQMGHRYLLEIRNRFGHKKK
jgi:hypothetical protein